MSRHIVISKRVNPANFFWYPDSDPDDSQNLIGFNLTKTLLLLLLIFFLF